MCDIKKQEWFGKTERMDGKFCKGHPVFFYCVYIILTLCDELRNQLIIEAPLFIIKKHGF